MPALNIRFTEEELDRLREQARDQGISMTALAHGLCVGRSERAAHNQLVMGASARIMALSEELLKRLADR
jgi:hypothetical protein